MPADRRKSTACPHGVREVPLCCGKHLDGSGRLLETTENMGECIEMLATCLSDQPAEGFSRGA